MSGSQNETHISARPSGAAAYDLLSVAGLPTDDLADVNLDDFFFAGPAAAPTGLVGLQISPPHALLRSLVVVPEARRAGLGARLVAHAEACARGRGVRSVYLLTTTAERFFAQRGYVHARKDEAPTPIRETREFASLCPATSVFMMKRIS